MSAERPGIDGHRGYRLPAFSATAGVSARRCDNQRVICSVVVSSAQSSSIGWINAAAWPLSYWRPDSPDYIALFRLPFANLPRRAPASSHSNPIPDGPTPRSGTASTSTTAVVDVLGRSRSTRPFLRVPRGMALAPGDVVCVPARSARGGGGGCGGECQTPMPRLHNRLKDVTDKLGRAAPPEGGTGAAWSTGSPITRCPPAAWCCA